MKKITVSCELTYVLALMLLSFSVAMLSAADCGLSMIVSPAYILSQSSGFLTFGQAEYVIQALLFVLFCALMRRVRLLYFCSFLSGLVYGAILDFWRRVIPAFDPATTAPGSFPPAVRVALFLGGVLLTALAVALSFRTYFYPQVYDFFVKAVSARYGIDTTRFKRGFDAAFLLLACAMTLALFRRFVGVGIGTLIITVLNGPLIGWFGKTLEHFFTFRPSFPALSRRFTAAIE